MHILPVIKDNSFKVGIVASLDDKLLQYCFHCVDGSGQGVVIFPEPDQIPESVGIYLIHYAHLMTSFVGIILIDANRVDPQRTRLVS